MGLSRQRILDADSKGVISGGTQSVFLLILLEKIEKRDLNFLKEV